MLRHAVIRRNQTNTFIETGGAGGLLALGGTVRVEDSLFEENTYSAGLGGVGGGLLLSAYNPVVLRTRFVRNGIIDVGPYAIAEGGGAYVPKGVSATFIDCVFEGNYVVAERTDPGGFGHAYGGGLASRGSTQCANCLFVGNRASVLRTGSSIRAYGGAIYAGGPLSLVNSTVSGNTVEGYTRGGAGVFANDLTLSNAIIWGNTGAHSTRVTGEATAMRSIVEGGLPDGTAILDLNPDFVRDPTPGPDATWGTADDDYGDLRLQAGSPALDFGDTALLPPDTFDLDGDGDTTEPLPLDLEGGPRIAGASVDLGAYEGGVHVANEPEADLPASFLLAGAYPNPFNPATHIVFDLPETAEVTITVFDALGREVRRLTPGRLAAGSGQSVVLDGRGLASGLYLYRVTAHSASATHTASGTVTLLK